MSVPPTTRRTVRPRLTALEDRLTPASVVNVAANAAEANQASLTANFTQSETAAVAFGSGSSATIILAYNDSGSFAGGNRYTGYARSNDGGATFADLGALTAANDDGGTPVLARDNTSGRVYLATLPNTGTTLKFFRSFDSGATFQSPIDCMPGLTTPSFDKPWVVVDNVAGSGQGNVYVFARDFGTSNSLVFSRSTDGGVTFANAVSLVSGGSIQGANVVVNSDHSVSVFWLSGTSLLTRRSTDFGATFGSTVTVATLTTTGSNGDLGLTRSATNSTSFRSNAFPQVAVNPTATGTIYVAYADRGAGGDKADIKFTTSTNFGVSWSAPVVVNADGTTRDQFQPSLRVAPDGSRLSVGWYDRRLDAANSLLDYFARPATISGGTVTFGAEQRISNASWLPDFGRDSAASPNYMGDYDQGAATDSHFVYAWGDNRLGGPDVRVATVPFAATGPQVIDSTPTGTVATVGGNIDVNFNQAMNTGSFDVASDVVSYLRGVTDVRGEITGFSWLNGNRTLRLAVTSVVPGNYTLTLGTNILSAGGSAIDDNLNGTAGETADRYVAAFTIASPQVTSSTPSGSVAGSVPSLTFNFSQPMDTASFAVATDVASFTGTAGNLLQSITGFTWVTSQQLRIDIVGQSLAGAYSLVLNPSILNASGFALDSNANGSGGEVPGDRYTASFTIGTGSVSSPNGFGYRSAATPYNAAFNLVPGAGGVTELTTLGNTDDDTASVSLGGNTFNFYGTSYSTLFVSSNGNIHFGSANSEYANTDLASSPSQAWIAGLWDDLFTSLNTATDDVVVYQIVGSQLIVNWRNVHYLNGSSSDNGITFQIVLQLNTGANPGAIVVNYTDLDDPGAQTGGAQATVGVKNTGTNPAASDPLVAALNGNNATLIGSNKAVRIFRNTSPTAVANGPYNVTAGGSVVLSSAGSNDADGDTLTYLWDLDGDGTYGETGLGALYGPETGATPSFVAPAGLPGGAYAVALRVVDTNGTIGNATATVNVTGSVVLPRVASVQVNGSANVQRSSVRSLVVTFNQAVTLPGNVASAFRLEKLGTGGGDVAMSATSAVVGGVTVVTLTFSGGFTEGAGAASPNPSLVDGNYRLTVFAAQVTAGGNPLDGDGNGTAGDNYVLGNAAADNLYRFYGDVNGDRSISGGDFGAFRLAFGTSTGQAGYLDFFDFNGDGSISGADFGNFRLRFGTTLSFP